MYNTVRVGCVKTLMVGPAGLEPARLKTLEPKSSASTNSARGPSFMVFAGGGQQYD